MPPSDVESSAASGKEIQPRSGGPLDGPARRHSFSDPSFRRAGPPGLVAQAEGHYPGHHSGQDKSFLKVAQRPAGDGVTADDGGGQVVQFADEGQGADDDVGVVSEEIKALRREWSRCRTADQDNDTEAKESC